MNRSTEKGASSPQPFHKFVEEREKSRPHKNRDAPVRQQSAFDTTGEVAYVVPMETVNQNETVVTLTASAAEEIRAKLAAEPGGDKKGLRLYVEKGGCSGLQYGMVFDEKRPDDLAQTFFGVSVWVDPFSADYLRGSIIDFSDALTGGGFKITNPQAAQSCGCGRSFDTGG